MATLFTLGTAIALVVVFLGEKTTRMPEASAASNAVRLERGASDYEQYCAGCHGLAGQGLANETGAPSLYNIVARKTTVQDAADPASSDFTRQYGIKEKYGTMRNYIVSTLIAGIRGAAMPAWGQEAGGPLRRDQIENITDYVLAWNGQVPASTIALAETVAADARPTADPGATDFGKGKSLFSTKGCVGCHGMGNKTLVGPGLGGLFDPEGTQAYGTVLPNGKTVDEATVFEWIVKGTAGFDERHVGLKPDADQAALLAAGVMPAVAVTEDEYKFLLVYLKAYNQDGTQKPGADAPPATDGGTLKPTAGTTPQAAASAAANQPDSGQSVVPQPAASASAEPQETAVPNR